MNLSLKRIADYGNRAKRNNSDREKTNQIGNNSPESSYYKVIRKREGLERKFKEIYI